MKPYTNLSNRSPEDLAALDRRFWRFSRLFAGGVFNLEESIQLIQDAKRSGDLKLMEREIDRLMLAVLEQAHYAKGVVGAVRGYADTDERQPGDAMMERDYGPEG